MKILALLLVAGLSVNVIMARTDGNSVSGEIGNFVSWESENKLITTEKTDDAKAFAAADWGWTELGKGAQAGSARLRLFDSDQCISVVRYRASKFRTCIANEPGKDADSTSAIAGKYGAIAAINGSYFDMGELLPVTYVKDDGVQEGRTTPSEANLRVDGLVGIRRGHKLTIAYSDTLSYDKTVRKCREAMAAGSILLKDGVPQTAEGSKGGKNKSFYEKRHPRSLIGTTSDGWVYMIVIDGRSSEAAGATIGETAEIARMFGLNDAINLDGGGSSTLWTASEGVINHPSDNRKFDHAGQRIVPNIIYVK